MTLSVTIPDRLAEELLEFARARGKSPEEIALTAIERELSASTDLSTILAPVREAFTHSGLSENEAVDIFEEEKHALRKERRAGSR
jgi:hypothetical protein